MPPLHYVVSNLRKNAEYIKFLTLSSNHVGLDFLALIDAIHTNHTLRQVNCHANFLAHLTAEQIETLMEACATLPQLQELSVSLPLNRTHLSSLVVDRCVRGQCPKLRKLVLRGFDPKACRAIAACLSDQPSLSDIQLLDGTLDSDSNEEGSGVSAMAKALQDNNAQLEKLVVSAAILDIGDIVAMADALASNNTLQRLDMRCSTTSSQSQNACTTSNKISSVDYTPLLNVFDGKQNETLRSLQTDAPANVQAALQLRAQLNASGATQLMRQMEVASQPEWFNVIQAMVEEEEQEKPYKKAGHIEQDKDDDDKLSLLFYTLLQEPAFLLSYSPDHDRRANERPLLRHYKARSVPCLSTHNDNEQRNLNLKRRKKVEGGPPCYALNVPY